MTRTRLHRRHGDACERAQLRADYFTVSAKLERQLDFREFALRWKNVTPNVARIAPGRAPRLAILTELTKRAADSPPPMPIAPCFPSAADPFAREILGDDLLESMRRIDSLRQRVARQRVLVEERARAMMMAVEIARRRNADQRQSAENADP